MSLRAPAALGLGLWCVLFAGSRPADVPFEKKTLDLGANETAAIADVNGDGKPDIVAGENWYQGPGWKQHRFRELPFANNYIDGFSDLPFDVDRDGHVDVVTCAWFGKKLKWWKNPGRGQGVWKEQPIQEGFNIEFCFLVDMDNDGQAREVLPQFGNANAPLAWYEFQNGAWQKRQVAEKSYGHGIGAGDLNGDGRTDVLVPGGWFEAPADPRGSGWTWHADFEALAIKSPGFMHVMDVNGDGKRDVVTGLAHDYGVLYLENQGEGKFKKIVIDDSWSQPHALTVADLNGDGQPDFLTGKRYMAHNGKDPGEREPLGLYWYEFRRAGGGKVEWTRHLIDYGTRAGGGMQLPVGDLDGDGDPDFVAPGKSGLFLFENKTK
ncbi:MAG: VCBS repeat-containing protein [Bryobacteraceae bacterium]|nr:VCBS repeat-containing protein [Bryobacteraceae bacterium]